MRAHREIGLLTLVCVTCALWVLPARADTSVDVVAMKEAAQRFVDGVNGGNGTAVQAVVTPPLWGRLAPAFSGVSPGAFGSLEVTQVGLSANRSDFTSIQVLWHQPDGVEDLVTVTLKQVGSEWRVSGISGRTAASPLQ